MQGSVSDRDVNLRNAATLQNPIDRAIAALHRAIDETVTSNPRNFSTYVRAELLQSVREGQYAMWPGIWKPKSAGDFSISDVNSRHWTVLTNEKNFGKRLFHIVPQKTSSGAIFYRIAGVDNVFQSWNDAVFWLVGQKSLKAADPTQAFSIDLLPEDATNHDPLLFPTDLISYNLDVKSLARAYAQQQKNIQSTPPTRQKPHAGHAKIPQPPAVQYDRLAPDVDGNQPKLPAIQYGRLPGDRERIQPLLRDGNIKEALKNVNDRYILEKWQLKANNPSR